jgi:hypothetical protein
MATSYPYRTDDRLYAADLDWDLEFNPGPNPPGSPWGGAGMFKYWIDTSAAATLPTLRQCIVPRAKNTYDPMEWMTIGVIDVGAREFTFDQNVHFTPPLITLTGDVYGSGTITIPTQLASINTTVGEFQGLTLDAKGRVTIARDMRYAPLDSPVFINFPQAPTQPVSDYSDNLATTKFVGDFLVVNAVTSWNTRTGHVILTLDDITDAGGAPIDSPDFLGIPTAVTAPPNTNTTQLATCEFVIGSSSHTSVSELPPPDPVQGDAWFSSTLAELYIYFDDGNSAQWVIANTAPTMAAAKYNIGFSFTGGVLGASQLIGLHKLSKAIQIPANFGPYAGHSSSAGATANATASAVLMVGRATAGAPNTFSQIGTITYAAASATGVFATTGGTAVDLNQGDVLRVIGPATADTTLANVYLTIVAKEA